MKYDTNGILSGSPGAPQVRDYLTMLKEKHRDPVASPQEWFDLKLPNRILVV